MEVKKKQQRMDDTRLATSGCRVQKTHSFYWLLKEE
jgi:hypothetical protein